MSILLLAPVHLYKNLTPIRRLQPRAIYLCEFPRFFTDYQYHKLKLAYHRATMKYYESYLRENLSIPIHYVNTSEVDSLLSKVGATREATYIYDCNDHPLHAELEKKIPAIELIPNLNFLNTNQELQKNQVRFKKNEKYHFMSFYIFMRRKYKILMKNGEPEGGQWSFDEENRKKIPAHVPLPSTLPLQEDPLIEEAKEYVTSHFPDHYGSLDHFVFPITHANSQKHLVDFLEKKLDLFGPYEDATLQNHHFLWHSVLTPMLNVGLLTDQEVLEATKVYEGRVRLSSYEGFIRQLIGWRNYIYMIYLLEGESMKKMNALQADLRFTPNLYKRLWEGKLGIDPIDDAIGTIVQYGYVHHIVRLMYLGNFLLLLMLHPDDVYRIFMEWTVDAYDWVMVPNIYGMTQYADGGKTMTRIYCCSSNYILKMSDYQKGDWCKYLDALYYRFIERHQVRLSQNYATKRQVYHWHNKTGTDQEIMLSLASSYLKTLM